jgi:uncharacterized protein YoaH (UPF0181 family)
MPCKPVNESYPAVTNIIDLKSWGLIAAIAIVASNLRPITESSMQISLEFRQ